MKNSMDFLHNTFSDLYARRNNWLTRIDVRIKLLYIIALLSINLWSKNIFISLSFLCISFVFLLSIKIPFVHIIRSMLLPISLALLIMIIKGLHEGESAWVSFSMMGYTVILKEEGLRSGLHICCKVLGGVSLIILLSLTTTISQLCTGLKWFRVPDTLIELLAFISRYIFLLFEEVATIWTAQKSRLGHVSWKKTVMSFGALGGMLIIRAFERAERTSEAMHARGYQGNSIFMGNLPRWKKKEYLSILGMVFVVSILIYTGNW